MLTDNTLNYTIQYEKVTIFFETFCTNTFLSQYNELPSHERLIIHIPYLTDIGRVEEPTKGTSSGSLFDMVSLLHVNEEIVLLCFLGVLTLKR